MKKRLFSLFARENAKPVHSAWTNGNAGGFSRSRIAPSPSKRLNMTRKNWVGQAI
jgi:hypothetical protein